MIKLCGTGVLPISLKRLAVLIFENLKGWVWLTDKSGKIVFTTYKALRYTGLSADELLSKTVMDCVLLPEFGSLPELMSRQQKQGNDFSVLILNRRREKISVKVKAQMITDDTNDIYYLFMFYNVPKLDLLNSRVTTRTKNLLFSLLNDLRLHDLNTYMHCRRTGDTLESFAKYLGISQHLLSVTRFLGLIHDVGKLRVTIDILNKTGKLSDIDFDIIKTHPENGALIIKHYCPSEEVLIQAVDAHHENYDGSGYPNGLAGDDIPLLAQLLRIVDSFDAMTHDRPHVASRSPAEALAEIKAGIGTLYQPVFAQKFIEFVEFNATSQANCS